MDGFVNFIIGENVMKNVKITIFEDTFSTLLAGLYATYHDMDMYAIPPYFWMMLSNALIPYLDDWMYSVQSLEDWIKNYLIITAKEVCTPEELEGLQKNTIYIEALNGNVTLVASGDILWENSINI